jgi:hypothetical protein
VIAGEVNLADLLACILIAIFINFMRDFRACTTPINEASQPVRMAGG